MIANSRCSNEYDVIVIGAGHAGCEASLAAARMGKRTVMFCTDIESVAMMPCNPSIGGTGKGHLVREIDALGGEMGLNIDKTFIQSKMLNTSKGPAVHSLRAQADKKQYHLEMLRTIEAQDGLDLIVGEVVELIAPKHAASIEKNRGLSSERKTKASDILEKTSGDDNASLESNLDKHNACERRVTGVRLADGTEYRADAVIICTGTFLGGKIFIGDEVTVSGPSGMPPACRLAEYLRELGFPLRRFKTGTPARLRRQSHDFSRMKIQLGDQTVVPFSFLNEDQTYDITQVPCWLSYTNEETHRIILDNIEKSAMYSGNIVGVGPRYCPSIEDKVARFRDRKRHQLFVEPEAIDSDLMYIQGMSSSLPVDVQLDFYHSITGLEHAEMVKPAYAIEYDCIDPLSLKPSLESKFVQNLFCAGQFNGSSGYEEAASQGLLAGINAVRKLDNKEPLILRRDQAYIGVLIDDLVTKGTNEPYRIMTSRAEYRLLLRQDNADRRLTEIGHEYGLVSEARYQRYLAKKKAVDSEIERLRTKKTDIGTFREFLIIQEFDFYLERYKEKLEDQEQQAQAQHLDAKTAYSLIKLRRKSLADSDSLCVSKPQSGASHTNGDRLHVDDASQAKADNIYILPNNDDKPPVRFEAPSLDDIFKPYQNKELMAELDSILSAVEQTGNQTFADLLRRPSISYDSLAQIDDETRPSLGANEKTEVEVMLKYDGYIKKQLNEIEKLKSLENKKLSDSLDYASIKGLRLEARQKLNEIKPLTVGQASRISGVSPADINVLLIYLEKEMRSTKI